MLNHRRAAGMLCIAPSGRVLLCRRSDTGTWATPAGRMEAGEQPRETALRELAEETGYSGPVSGIELVVVWQGFYLFSGHVNREFEPTLDHEHSEAVWCAPRRPPKPLHPGLKRLLPL